VVVDHVEDHLEAVRMEAVDHVLELVDLRSVHVARVEREEADGVVAPEVGQALLEQRGLVQEHLHRQQFHAGHAERADRRQHLVARHAREGAAELLGHLRMLHREAAHVGLVEHGLGPGHAQRIGLRPLEARVDHHALGHQRRAVALVEAQVAVGMAHGVAEQLGAPLQRPHVGLGIGVEQQLVVVEAVALLGFVGTVHAQAVARAGLQAGHEAVPDLVGVLGQGDAAHLRGAGLVEDADVDPRGMRREHGEVDAVAVEAGAERVRGAFEHRQGGRNVRGVGHGVWVIGWGLREGTAKSPCPPCPRAAALGAASRRRRARHPVTPAGGS
jgi:hypothetical protein